MVCYMRFNSTHHQVVVLFLQGNILVLEKRATDVQRSLKHLECWLTSGVWVCVCVHLATSGADAQLRVVSLDLFVQNVVSSNLLLEVHERGTILLSVDLFLIPGKYGSGYMDIWPLEGILFTLQLYLRQTRQTMGICLLTRKIHIVSGEWTANGAVYSTQFII